MNKTNQQQEYRMGVGASSVLMIFVLLSLTTLSVLSFASARADLTLTQRRQIQVEAYYTAAAEAQRILASLDEKLLAAPKDADDYKDYVRDLEDDLIYVSRNLTISFTVPISESQELDVSIRALGPDSEKRYEMVHHRVINILEWVPDDTYW